MESASDMAVNGSGSIDSLLIDPLLHIMFGAANISDDTPN
jgi:hypothetical protein